MAKDFRYLGAHLTTRQTITSSTLEARWDKAMQQPKRLPYCPATVEANSKIILAKTYVAATYAVEAAHVQPVRVARLTAMAIDTFRAKNDNHSTDMFFATLNEEAKDVDPVLQICCNNEKAQQRF